MSYYIAQPRRSLQDHAKRVDHVLVRLSTFGTPGTTACGRTISGDWDVERREKVPEPETTCWNCVNKAEHWPSDL